MCLTVVVPVYNCARWVLPKLDEILAYFSQRYPDWELIVVDDGSRDETAELARRHLAGRCCARVIALERNSGKGWAVLTGLRAGRGRHRVFMDCDLAYPLSEAQKVIAALENGADAAVANRRLPDSVCELKPALFKQVYSRYRYGKVFNAFVRTLGLTRSSDTQAGLKGVRDVVVPVLDAMRTSRFAFDIEFLHLIEMHQFCLREVPVRYGFFEEESSIEIVADGWRMMLEVLHIKVNSLAGRYTNGRH